MRRFKSKHAFWILTAFLGLLLLERGTPLLVPSEEKVNLEARTSHARELLGATYQRSPASHHEKNLSLESQMQIQIQKRLHSRDQGRAEDITRAIIRESRRHGLDPVFLMAVINTESRFRIRARGAAGEIGLMQLKPDTAEWIAGRAKIPWRGEKSLEDPVENIRLGTAYFAYLRGEFSRQPRGYIAAYNLGPNLAKRSGGRKVMKSPYPGRVMGHYEALYRELTGKAGNKLAAL